MVARGYSVIIRAEGMACIYLELVVAAADRLLWRDAGIFGLEGVGRALREQQLTNGEWRGRFRASRE